MAYTTINDPSAYFQTTLYTGNGSSGHAITNTGNADLQPDWVWIKSRSNAVNHGAWDTTRGANNRLLPDTTGAAETQTNFTSFNSDGFTVDTGNIVNTNAYTYVGWQWKAAGGTTASNGNGSITSTVQANTTAGFSIVKWTGTGSAATIGHGLGVTPQMIIVKNLDKSAQWAVYTESLGNTKYLALSDDDAAATYSGYWNDTSPTTTVFSVGSDGDVSGGNGEEVISYVFSSIKGYSKFGGYKGNGNADGTFVYTGFKPAFLMIKRTSGQNHWHMFDNKRDPDNVVQKHILADLDNAEASNTWGDLLSNGFKLRTTLVGVNGSGDDYIYMAFAENPFVATNNVAGTAR